VKIKKSTSVHFKWCGELKFCFHRSNTIYYITGTRILFYIFFNWSSAWTKWHKNENRWDL